MSVSNNDENKTFGVVFRTPVEDSTGIPHILEHSVLNGSKKYPIKEPFVELIKGSLHTFINAFTYPDRTCYPVASTNLQVFSLSYTKFSSSHQLNSNNKRHDEQVHPQACRLMFCSTSCLLCQLLSVI